MTREVEEKKAPGVSMLIARHGKIAYRQSVGALRPGGPAMTDDAIFRIYSMTKPIVSVAAMMLVEEGRLLITDPVSKYIPAFANVKVGVANGDKLDLAPLKRPITVQDLMRHTSGLDLWLHRRVARSEARQSGERRRCEPNSSPKMSRRWPRFRSCTSRARSGNTASPPTCSGASSKSSRAPRSARFCSARLFGPLDMVDTAFFTPESKLARRASRSRSTS